MMDKTFDPAAVEGRIAARWEEAGAFRGGRPDRAGAEAYSIVIPPPNVTGSLHMGHALNNTLQDVLCRFERMRGKDVLWQPGTDHAGIATQLVVTRQLADKGIDYKDLGREAFLEKVWAWKAESGGTIVNQLKRLGASCDWSRERFTMDEGLSKAVIRIFVDLYHRGLIYKDKRLVNWDPVFRSAVSDLEVESREHTGTFKWARGQVDKEGAAVAFDPAALNKVLDKDSSGHMYTIRYPLAGVAYDETDPSTYLMVGTTRPETMLGDTGVAIHPENERLKHLIGRKVALPLTGREIPVVGDDYADPEKGTGAVKITPAHDFNDWEVGKRAKLAVINILTPDGRILVDADEADAAGVPQAYRGMDRFEARQRIVADLAAQGLLEKIEPNTHAVPHAQRGDAVVEPFLTDQWYVDAATLAQPALEAVRAGKTRFVPEKYTADYFRWLENIQPWCISRQLWWGHQIPAWYGPKKMITDPEPWMPSFMQGEKISKIGVLGAPSSQFASMTTDFATFVAKSEKDALESAKKYYGKNYRVKISDCSELPIGQDEHGLYVNIWRDPDVLDTWFSSGLWPFSTLGWPEETKELKRFYPTSCLVTGFDIIFFWVARMMMMGVDVMKDAPFRDVYIHGLVRDEKGRKMSKSIGNVIDPLQLIDKYGADALRFTMAALTTQGRDVKLADSRVEGYRNFATKLWNAARFAEMNGCARVAGFDPRDVADTLNKWIIGETEKAVAEVTAAIEAYRFNDAAAAAYRFVWNIFCDWHLELAKPPLQGADGPAKDETRATIAFVLDEIMKLLHPFMPFMTEELWAIKGSEGPARVSVLALAEWPRLEGLRDAGAEDEIGWVIDLVSEIRSLRSEMNVPAGAQIPLVLVGADAAVQARAGAWGDVLKRLARLSGISFAEAAPRGAVQTLVRGHVAALPLEGVIDLAAEQARLAREIGKFEGEVKKIDAKLGNADFVRRAPEEVVEENRERRAEALARIDKMRGALAQLAAA
jgi:valyl-tRNA synthetase